MPYMNECRYEEENEPRLKSLCVLGLTANVQSNPATCVPPVLMGVYSKVVSLMVPT